MISDPQTPEEICQNLHELGYEARAVTVDEALYKAAFGSIGTTFRGEIYDNCARFKLVGSGYASMPREQDGHFDIATARHLAGPLRALLDPNVRVVIIIGATQVMKSVVGDIWLPYVMEHCPRPTIVYFEDDPKGKLFCEARLMQTIKAHPIIAKLISEIDRNDATKTSVKLPTMLLQVCGLNDGNVSSLSWPNIWVSEAWQHRNDGLLKKAIKRADRYPNDCKILIESQAGLAGEDLHREASSAHQVPLTWACPTCGGRQTWEFAQLRPEDFTPLPGGTDPKPGTYAGMQFEPEAGEGRENYSIAERARTAYWECFHCGVRIQDTRATRQAIMDTYEQDYQIAGPDGVKFSPRVVCFTLPKEAARDNSFEGSTKTYLEAKAAEASGNKTPIADWFMSDRAVFYSPRLTQHQVSIITATCDPSNAIPNEAARVMSVDCQQGEIEFKTGKFWYVARAIDKNGANLVQLARGYAENWGEWIAVQKALKIPNDNVAIDGGNYLSEILDAAAENVEVGNRFAVIDGRVTKTPVPCRLVWKILIGNGTRRSFPHITPKAKIDRYFSPPSKYQRTIPTAGGRFVTIDILVYHWSNLSVKDHLYNLLAGGPTMPKFLALKREQLPPAVQAKEVGDLTYTKQMQNEYRTTVRGINKWVEATPNVHYRDCECGCIVLFDMGGKLGLPPAPDEAAQ